MYPRRDFAGTPEQVDDAVRTRFEQDAANGSIINSVLPDSLQHYTERGVPSLQQRRLFRSHSCGTTLREHFDLPVPLNRHSIERLDPLTQAPAVA